MGKLNAIKKIDNERLKNQDNHQRKKKKIYNKQTTTKWGKKNRKCTWKNMKEFELENNKEKNWFTKEIERIKDKKKFDELKTNKKWKR